MSMNGIMQSYEDLDAAQKANDTPNRPSHASSSPQLTPNNSVQKDAQAIQNSGRMADSPVGSSPPTPAPPPATSSPQPSRSLKNNLAKEMLSLKEGHPSTTTSEQTLCGSSPAPTHRSASAPASESISSQRQGWPYSPESILHQAERQCVNHMLGFLEGAEQHSVYYFFGNFWAMSQNGKAEFKTASGSLCTAAKALEMIESMENQGYSCSWETLAKGWASTLREEGFFGTKPGAVRSVSQ